MITHCCPNLRRPIRRGGLTYLISMLFLVIFSTMALGFYSSCITSVQVAGNDSRSTRARLAAESGTAFMRYNLAHVNLPAGTVTANIITTVGTQLASRLNGTLNITGGTIGASSTAINIPSSASRFITINPTTGDGFRADLTLSGTDVLATISGQAGNNSSSGRGVQMNFRPTPNDTSVFGYGLATAGSVTLSNGVLKGIPDASRGSFMSTASSTSHPLTMSGSAVVSGQVFFTNAAGTVSGNGSISGTTNSSQWGPYIHTGVTPPEFPTVDTTPYLNYLNTVTPTIITGSTGATPLSNIRIKAGSNPSFSGGGTINGLIYIEAPNKVTFSGGTHITGVIVVDNPNESTSTNSITFSGGGTMLGPENLPASYGALRSMTGASILAPNFTVNMSGGSASFGGSMLVKAIGLSGGSGGSVNGTVISYGTASTTFSGGSGFTFTNTGAAAIPTTGVSFTGHLAPVSSTYTEIN